MTGAPNGLALPQAATAAIANDVTRYGRQAVETGGFMLASVGTNIVTSIALAGTTGIVRQPSLFQVSDLALDALFAHAEASDMWIPAQYHSHQFGAFMSDCDIAHGLSVDGFVSVIVPSFADPPRDPSAWGWWRFEGTWTPLAAPTQPVTEVTLFAFDEDGIREP